MADIAIKVAKLREKSGPVLILGESGTGKELIARTLHGNRKGTFKAVNCADYLLSKGTARSELFGHVKGAFTGADSDKVGIFESVNDGTIFLDEVYSLPPEAQVGLLRALQEKVITRLGGTKEVKIRCRVIAAGKPELVSDIAQESFKPDLYYRISQEYIVEVLKKSNGSLKDAASLMGISPPAVIYLLKKHGLKVKEKNSSAVHEEGRRQK